MAALAALTRSPNSVALTTPSEAALVSAVLIRESSSLKAVASTRVMVRPLVVSDVAPFADSMTEVTSVLLAVLLPDTPI